MKFLFSSGVSYGVASASTDVTLSFGMSVGQTSTVTTEKTFSKSFEVNFSLLGKMFCILAGKPPKPINRLRELVTKLKR